MWLVLTILLRYPKQIAHIKIYFSPFFNTETTIMRGNVFNVVTDHVPDNILDYHKKCIQLSTNKPASVFFLKIKIVKTKFPLHMPSVKI